MTVSWSIRPFVNRVGKKMEVDAGLTVRLLNGRQNANWQPITTTDRTQFARGDRTAVVGMRSRQPDVADMGLTVTFFGNEQRILPASDFDTEVVATIGQN
jgi:hypothetical protein